MMISEAQDSPSLTILDPKLGLMPPHTIVLGLKTLTSNLLSQLLSPSLNDEGEAALVVWRRERRKNGIQCSQARHSVKARIQYRNQTSKGQYPEGLAQGGIDLASHTGN
jgi:hypothetical protein